MKGLPQNTSQGFHRILFVSPILNKFALEFLLERLEAGLKPKTIENYLQTFRQFNFLRLSDFDRVDLTEWLAGRVASRNWSKATFANRLRQLYCFNRWLFYQSAVLRLHRAPRISTRPKRRDLPTQNEWTILFDSLRKRFESAPLGRRKSRWRDYLLCSVLLETGMRVSEAARLRVRDLIIHDADNFWLFTDGSKGADAERACPISQSLVDEIRAYLWTFKIQNKDSRLFVSKTGKDLDTIEFCKWLKSYCAKLELTADVTPHVFRYQFIITFIAGGGSALELQARLGHADLKQTVYYFNQVRRLLPFVKTNPDFNVVNRRFQSRASAFQRRRVFDFTEADNYD